MRIDPGIIPTKNNLTHPTPGGLRGVLGDKQFKNPGNVMHGPEYKKSPHPTLLSGVLGVNISNVGEIAWSAEKIDSFCNLSTPPTWEGEF